MSLEAEEKPRNVEKIQYNYTDNDDAVICAVVSIRSDFFDRKCESDDDLASEVILPVHGNRTNDTVSFTFFEKRI